ncbi:MAG: hypothetical protein JSS90_05880 [Bacteroidetes bacterium]|jgi:hypothetical protein|nr:hypothetical protein [Bacteroidota bacterium]
MTERRSSRNNNSPYILNASSNLLGLCFIVLTSIRVLKIGDSTLVDEITTVAFLIFMVSTILSFLSMRNTGAYSEKLELLADYIFMSGLFLLFIATFLITFKVIA